LRIRSETNNGCKNEYGQSKNAGKHECEPSWHQKQAQVKRMADVAVDAPLCTWFPCILSSREMRRNSKVAGHLARLEWVENPDVQLPEILFISRGNDQLVNACSRGNHRVLKQLIWLSVHDPAPLPKARRIHWEYPIRSCELICPRPDVTRLRWILAACPLNPWVVIGPSSRQTGTIAPLLDD
jgi:hypothetical protein